MTIGNLQEDVQRPVKVIQTLYSTKSEQSGDDFGVIKHFSDLLASGASIPVLTGSILDFIPNNSLVRVRGMVQDMLNPEIFCNEYLAADGSWRTARYQDEIHDAHIGNEVRYGDRRPYVIVPVPNESSWVVDAFNKSAEASAKDLPSKNSSSVKRPRDAQEPAEDISMLAADVEQPQHVVEDTAGTSTRRPRNETDTTAVTDAAMDAEGPSATAGGDIAASFPTGACMVYLYDESDSSLKLNDVVEVVGVVSRTPELAAAHMEAAARAASADPLTSSMLDEEMLAAHPPTSQVPRIHAILIKKEDSPAHDLLSSSPVSDLSSARSQALTYLTQALKGDALAAEYLLLQLVSSVHRRTKEGAVGVFPLNLINCPADTTSVPCSPTTLSPLGQSIEKALQALAPRCLSLPLTLENINQKSWVPRRGGEDSLMTSGTLQLAVGTHILADETVLSNGQLNETGLRNLGALQMIMQQQKIGYDFQFFVMDQPTDAPVIVLSTARTMLKGTGEVVVPLELSSEPAHVVAQPTEEALAAARAYIAAARALGNTFTIPEAVAGEVEKELAGAKQKDPSLTPDTFHVWLNMARLLAVSYGEKELSEERWRQALAMEKQREARVKMTENRA